MNNEAALLQNIDGIHNLLSGAREIGIIIGENQNIDKMAGSLSLYLALTEAGRSVQIISSVEPIVELSNLVGVDKIKKSFLGATKSITISVPYKEGDVEKVSYNTEGDHMNFNIIANSSGIQAFGLNDIKITSQGASPDLIIAIGTTNNENIKSLFEESQTKIVNIGDNAQLANADVTISTNDYSSISEIVTVILQELALPIQIDTAQNLLDGVMSATSSFRDPQTSSYAFEATAILLRIGAKRDGAAQVKQIAKTPPPFTPAGQSPLGGANPTPQQPQRFQPQYNSMAVENKESKPLSDEDFGEPQDIPSEWFEPKVFNRNKKPGQ